MQGTSVSFLLFLNVILTKLQGDSCYYDSHFVHGETETGRGGMSVLATPPAKDGSQDPNPGSLAPESRLQHYQIPTLTILYLR